MSEATGLNNLVRQLGGSFGVAIFASLLHRFSGQAKGALAVHVSSTDPAAVARLDGMSRALAQGSLDAQAAASRALMMLNGQISRQAAMLGFEKTFYCGGLLFLGAAPLVLLLDGKPKAPPQGSSPAQPSSATAEASHDPHMSLEI
jgi:DHA2 family multidrug resistance protein